ncbi:HPr family phosphocarrier protein [Pseudoalteromonas sp. SSM20]|uniref:HPr family phosphocarrier protein n=1 Tax=unclassified Pseudoalteromonas TaxID=194690 RepID=UPI00237E72C0|nr:HPr family phosphocarrier protein [Pseudoalteromonas sp. G4]MDE3271575.1 HPr family phosphocarrier protein [Pseudoalteromonas sp. G4]
MAIEKHFLIENKLGLHARAATQLAKLAMAFDAKISLTQGEKTADADSVLGLMLLESSQGKEVLVRCDGPDQDQALLAIGDLIQAKFNEDE